MLTYLTIRELLIIDILEIEFQPNLTVITGETGAGKSILLDALNLALGERVTGPLVRQNAERADITAEFDLAHIPMAKAWLENNELSDDNHCILRRTINKDNRSRCFINGQPVTLQQLSELGGLLLNLHSQHSTQALLSKPQQQQMLDNYANHPSILQTTQNLYQQWQEAHKKLEMLTQQAEIKNEKQQRLSADLEELEQLQLAVGEVEQLGIEQQRLANASSLLSAGQNALNFIQDDPDINAENLVNQALLQLQHFSKSDSELSEVSELLNQTLINLQESKSTLEAYLSQIEINPERLDWVEQRLSDIERIARKHRIHANELIALQEKLSAEYQQLDSLDQQLDALKATVKKTEQDYLTVCHQLTEKRTQAAEALSQAITKALHDLNMQKAKFHVELVPQERYSLNGLEQIVFHLQTNPGQPMQPLNKIASGGELSRVNLAIQALTAQQLNAPTLIFDEVDVGIGGQTAAIVGQKLNDLAQKTQVICITHLPQVAAYGEHHLHIAKQSDEDTTQITLTSLGKNERIKEMARMLGGLNITQQTLAHAEEMLLAVSS